MNKVEIFVFSAALAIAAVRLYQRYIKKDKSKSEADSKTISGTKFSSSPGDDEYEPYSNK
jgi:hypothetical protein